MADDDIFDFKDENISHLNLPSLHSFLQPVANPKTSKPTASKVRSMASTKPTTTKLTFNSHDPPMNRTRRGRPAAKFKIPKIPTFLPHVDPLIQLQPFNNNFNFVQTDNVSSPLFQCENLLAKENEAFEKLNSTISNVEPSRQTEDETARFHLLDDNCDDISMLNVTVPVNSIEKTLNILVGNQTNGNSDDNIEPIQNDFVNAEKFSNSTKDVTIKKDATLQITEVKTKEEAIKLLMTRLSNYDVIPNHAPIAKSDDRVNALLYPDDCSILINSLSPDPLERSFFRLSLAHEALINVSPVFSEGHLTTRDLATVKDDSSVGTHYTTASKFEVYVDTSIPLTDNSSVHLHPDQQTASLNTKSDASILSVSKAQTLDILPIEKMASILSPLPIFEPTVEEILEKSCIIEANIQSLQEFMSSKNKHVIKAQSDYQLVKKEELILPNKNVASHTPSLRTSLLDTPSTLVKTSESINDNPFLSPGLGKPVSNLLEKFQSFVAHENDWIRFLLVGCNQHNVSPFSALFQNIADTQITKIGESTYSEVFLCKDKILTVIKIIPVRTSLEENQDSFYQENVYKEGTDIPYASRAMDVFNEVIMTKKLSPFFQSSSDNFNIDSTGFISYLHAYLVQGKYPEKLLGVWKEFDQEKSSENISPEHFPADQHFIILMMSYGGTDLEKFTLNSIHQAFSILQQLVVSIIYSQNVFIIVSVSIILFYVSFIEI